MAGNLAAVASGFIGNTRPEIVNKTGYSPNTGDWCAWFVWCCLNQIGYSYSASQIADSWGSWCFKQAVANGSLPGTNYSYGSVSIQAGDIITFRTSKASYGSHVAIMAGADTVINGNWWVDPNGTYDTSIVASRSIDRTINGLLDEPGETMVEITITRLNDAGGGGGDDPDVPPEPQPGGHWEWVDGETIEVLVPVAVDIRESECGRGVAADQTGSQDEPKAPYQMDGNPDGSRLNERWEPFNMYTYERTETYDQNYNPVWSSWEQKYLGSQTIMLGEQPSYGNGWEMDWGDE